MNSMQRLGKLLSGEKPDRKLFTATLSMYGAKLINCPLKEYYTSPKKYFEGQKEVAEKIKPDILFSPFSLPLEANAFGSSIKYFEKNPPNVSIPAINSYRNINDLKVPDINKSWQHQYFLDSIKLMADKYKGIIPIASPVPGPVDLPLILLGIEGWLEMFLFHQKEAQKLISILTDYFVEWTDKIFEAGADFAVIPIIFCNNNFINQHLFNDEIKELYRNAFSQVKGPLVIHHVGAKILNFLDTFADMPNVAGIVPDHRESLSEARARIKPNQLLIGNLDGPTLYRYSPEQMKKVCKHKKEQMKNDFLTILATSNADVAYDTPLETLQAIYEFVEEEWRFDA